MVTEASDLIRKVMSNEMTTRSSSRPKQIQQFDEGGEIANEY